MNTAPACSYSLTPPLELKGVQGVAANGGEPVLRSASALHDTALRREIEV